MKKKIRKTLIGNRCRWCKKLITSDEYYAEDKSGPFCKKCFKPLQPLREAFVEERRTLWILIFIAIAVSVFVVFVTNEIGYKNGFSNGIEMGRYEGVQHMYYKIQTYKEFIKPAGTLDCEKGFDLLINETVMDLDGMVLK